MFFKIVWLFDVFMCWLIVCQLKKNDIFSWKLSFVFFFFSEVRNAAHKITKQSSFALFLGGNKR